MPGLMAKRVDRCGRLRGVALCVDPWGEDVTRGKHGNASTSIKPDHRSCLIRGR